MCGGPHPINYMHSPKATIIIDKHHKIQTEGPTALDNEAHYEQE